jgi:hypothetical protein
MTQQEMDDDTLRRILNKNWAVASMAIHDNSPAWQRRRDWGELYDAEGPRRGSALRNAAQRGTLRSRGRDGLPRT